METLQPVERQVGAVFAIRGRIAGLDAFDQPATWRRLMPKLLRSYGLDSVDHAVGGDGFSRPEPERFLKAASLTKVDVFPAVGLGQDLRFDGGDIVGGALATDRGIVHVAVFPTRGPVRPANHTSTAPPAIALIVAGRGGSSVCGAWRDESHAPYRFLARNAFLNLPFGS